MKPLTRLYARWLAFTFAVASAGIAGAVLANAGGGAKATKVSRKAPTAGVVESVVRGAVGQREVAAGRDVRKAIEAELEASIARDGRILAGRGFLRGPVIGSTCTLMGSIASTAAGVVGRYNCLAIKRKIDQTLEGARFFGTINFTTRTYTFRGD